VSIGQWSDFSAWRTKNGMPALHGPVPPASFGGPYLIGLLIVSHWSKSHQIFRCTRFQLSFAVPLDFLCLAGCVCESPPCSLRFSIRYESWSASSLLLSQRSFTLLKLFFSFFFWACDLIFLIKFFATPLPRLFPILRLPPMMIMGVGMMCVFYKSNVVGSVADLRPLIGWARCCRS